MAKRKRLSSAAIIPGEAAPETKTAFGWGGHGTRRAPIADVSGDAAQQSAFEEVAEELRAARAEGRMVLRLPLAAVEAGHLVRDRISADPEEMTVLVDSLRVRGQQTPIEVEEIASGRYGLISGWRRLQALSMLAEEDTASFGFVQALVRSPEGAADAYRSMVEENEIRANLSFYERARIAVQAARQGVYSDTKTAVQSLFSAVRAPKRSKIVSFTALVEALDDVLLFPTAIPEKLGLPLAAALQERAGFTAQLTAALRAADPMDAAEERKILEQTLRGGTKPAAAATVEVVLGVKVQGRKGHITLSGRGVDADLLTDLRAWLARRKT